MKKSIPVILVLVLVMIVFMLFDVSVIYQVSEEHYPLSDNSQAFKKELDEKTKAQLITKYQQEAEMRHWNTPQQTILYNEIECLSLITSEFSLLFHVSGISRGEFWSEPGTLNDQTVNMNYTSYNYIYEYRMLDKNTNKENGGVEALLLITKHHRTKR